jgi:poly(3-hydroxybutyrate) depolymerase
VVRLQELAKARRVAIIVPQAPNGLLGSNLGSSWPFRPEFEPVADYVRFLDGVVADARSRLSAPSLPLYVAGLSNGASMAYNYACSASQPVAAFMAVAGSMSSGTRTLCSAAQVPGSVIVHGTSDVLNPYQGLLSLTMSVPQIHSLFESLSRCSGSDGSVQLKQVSSSLPVIVSYSASCSNAKRHYLATVTDGGHNWPGQAASTNEITLGLLGFKTPNFDATIQGYDLMVEAGGN